MSETSRESEWIRRKIGLSSPLYSGPSIKWGPLAELRREWFQKTIESIEKGVSLKGSLSEESLKCLDSIMKEETGYDLNRLGKEFLFRFSGVITTQPKINFGEQYVLTERKDKDQGKKYSFPGGKIEPQDLPFTMYLFAKFWKLNQSLVSHVFKIPDSDTSSLLNLLKRRNPKEMGLVEGLEKQMEALDMPFYENYSKDICAEGYREFWEEFELPKLGTRHLKRERHLRTKYPVFITSAKPIGLFLDLYRAAAPDQKKFFVSFNYQMKVFPPGFKKLDKAIRTGAFNSREVGSIRWTSFIEGIMPGSEAFYQSNVPYTLRRMIERGMVDVPSSEYSLLSSASSLIPNGKELSVVGT